MHIYHFALSWAPTSSPTRQLYEHELIIETKLVNAVGFTWDACIRIFPVALHERVKAVVFSPSGAFIAAYGNCGMKVFDAMTGVNQATFDGNKFIYSVAFSPDDGFLVSGLSGGAINVWDVQTGTMFQTFTWNTQSSTYSVAFSSCGTMIASGDDDGTVQIWNMSGDRNGIFEGHSGAVTNVCWLGTWNQVVSASNDDTIRIWDVWKQTCLKIIAQSSDPVAALASSQDLLLSASIYGTVNIYDSQSGDIIHVIRSNGITHSHFSIDGDKVLVASSNLGDIWDITTSTLTHVWSIKYNGNQVIFSPDGTHVASIYGKFVKIWKTNTEYNHHEAFTHVHDTIDDVYISPDEQLVILESKKGVNILDATTSQSLFTCLVATVPSSVFSLDSAFVAFISSPIAHIVHNFRPPTTVHPTTVHTWNAHTGLHKSIIVDYDVFHIALSPDGSQLASLSPSHMKLWDLKSEGWLAHLEFNRKLEGQAKISFSTDATSVSILEKSHGMQSWCISPNHNIDLTRDSIKNSDGTQTWLISHPLESLTQILPYIDPNHHPRDPINNHDRTKLPMVFVPTMEEQSNQDASVPCQSYHYKTDSEWIMDQDGRHILWIPPDERPRKFWNGFKHEKKILIQTESGKIYFVNFSQF